MATVNSRRNNVAKEKVEAVEAVEVVEVEATQEEEVVVTAPVAPVAKVKRAIQDTDKIAIMNNTTGRYGYRSKNGYAIDLDEYGDIAYIPFSELSVMKNSAKRHLTEPFIIILDEDVVEEFNYTQKYKNVFTEEQINSLLRNPSKLAEVLENMTPSMKEVVVLIARRRYEENELRSVEVLKILKEKLGLELMK